MSLMWEGDAVGVVGRQTLDAEVIHAELACPVGACDLCSVALEGAGPNAEGEVFAFLYANRDAEFPSTASLMYDAKEFVSPCVRLCS